MRFPCKSSDMGIVTRKPFTTSRKKILTVASLATTCFSIATIMFFVDPVLLIARYRTRIANNTAVHHLLQETLEVVHISAYLFNVTNADRFRSGLDEKLKVEEVGPFTYKELRHNKNMSIDSANGVIRYSPHITPVFMPEKSIAHPSDVQVTMPNIAMMTMVSMLSSYSFAMRMTANLLTNQLGSQPIVTMSAEDYLWGYNDSLITAGNTFFPGWITFDTMGLMDRMYDKKSNYHLVVGATDEDKFVIKELNGSPGLSVWDYADPSKRTKCNSFANAYEGIGYPPGLTPESPIRIFRNVLCRMLELDYVETRTLDYGPEALVYRISNRTFQNGPDKECTCAKGLCVDGVSDLSPCFYGLPLAMSNAHFLHEGPHLTERVEGLHPDEKKHGSEFLIDPKVGAVLETSFAIQVNIAVGDVTFNSLTTPFANMMLPIGYFKIVQPELPEQNKADLYKIYITGPYLVLGLQLTLFATGTSLLLYAARLLYWNWICNEQRGMAFQLPEDGKKMSMFEVELPLMGKDVP